MKIVQIIPVVGDNNFTNVWGLSDDNKVYTYSYKTGSWKLFKQTKKS